MLSLVVSLGNVSVDSSKTLFAENIKARMCTFSTNETLTIFFLYGFPAAVLTGDLLDIVHSLSCCLL